MMANALFAFSDPIAGRQVAQDLIDAGLPSRSVRVLGKDRPDDQQWGRRVDEQVTGGLLSNMLDLFQGVFDWGSSPHDAARYEETIRRGGAVLSVDAHTDMEREQVDRLVQIHPVEQRTDWSSLPAR